MKTPAKYVLLAAAASSAAVALFAIANSSITARFPFGLVSSIAASAALMGIIAYDYSRRAKSARFSGRVLRPAPRGANAPLNLRDRLEKSTRKERVAA